MVRVHDAGHSLAVVRAAMDRLPVRVRFMPDAGEKQSAIEARIEDCALTFRAAFYFNATEVSIPGLHRLGPESIDRLGSQFPIEIALRLLKRNERWRNSRHNRFAGLKPCHGDLPFRCLVRIDVTPRACKLYHVVGCKVLWNASLVRSGLKADAASRRIELEAAAFSRRFDQEPRRCIARNARGNNCAALSWNQFHVGLIPRQGCLEGIRMKSSLFWAPGARSRFGVCAWIA